MGLKCTTKRGRGEPCSDFSPMLRTDVVADEVNGADGLVNLGIHCVQAGDEFPRPLPLITMSIDLARAGVKGRKEMERVRPLVRIRHAVGPVGRLGGQGRPPARRGVGRESVWLIGAQGPAGQRPAGPRRLGSAQQPAAGEAVPAARAQWPAWSIVANVPRSIARWATGQCVRLMCGHLPYGTPSLHTGWA
jgi:hypothetical protein